MSKKRPHHNDEVPPTRPITYRCIYTAEADPVRASFVATTMFSMGLAGIGYGAFSSREILPNVVLMGHIFVSQQKLIGVCFLLAAAFMFLGRFHKTVHSVVTNGKELIFSYRLISYRLVKSVFQVGDIQSVDWATGPYWLRPGSPRIHFTGDLAPVGWMVGKRTYLLVRTKNGKKLHIPGSPYSDVDQRKILLDWLERYQSQALENPAIPN